jgi:CheY-like chemotaxis protein
MARTRVLIVDDDALVRAVLGDLFAEGGYVTSLVKSAEQALALLKTQLFDVLLTDLRLPAANGLQLMHVCRKIAPKMRTVAMSAFASAADYKAAQQLGVVEFLVKPFQPDEVMEAVRRAEHRRPGYEARFNGLSLVDVLQMCNQLRQSVTVKISNAGTAHFVDGELVHAAVGRRVGEDALVALLRTEGLHLSVEAPVPVLRSIEGSFTNTLLNAVTRYETEKAEAQSRAEVRRGDEGFSARLDAELSKSEFF